MRTRESGGKMALMMFERGADPLEAAFAEFFGGGHPFGRLVATPPAAPGRKCGRRSAALGGARRRLALDVEEHADSYKISADLPGVKREAVQLEVGHDGVLQLSVEEAAEKKVRFNSDGETKEPAEEGADGESGDEKEPAVKWRRVERARRFESRRVQLPPDADVEKVHASLEDGVLLLSVPKKPEPTSPRFVVNAKYQ